MERPLRLRRQELGRAISDGDYGASRDEKHARKSCVAYLFVSGGRSEEVICRPAFGFAKRRGRGMWNADPAVREDVDGVGLHAGGRDRVDAAAYRRV